jgi:hypothetical protein
LTCAQWLLHVSDHAEARSIRDRLKRPDEKWEKEFARYREDRDLSRLMLEMAGRVEAEWLVRSAGSGRSMDTAEQPLGS